jgi:hypothetical protein
VLSSDTLDDAFEAYGFVASAQRISLMMQIDFELPRSVFG